MRRIRALRIGPLAALLLTGCNDKVTQPSLPPAPSVTVTTTASDSRFSPSQPFAFTVEAKNTGSAPALLGNGSSSCMCSAEVQLGDNLYLLEVIRICTADETPHWLQPGEVWRERLP